MLTKPSWLRSWLDRLNWDIFTWQVYVGDAVEGAIDWVIDGLNNALDWGTAAYNWAQAAWDRISQVSQELISRILTETSRIWDWVSTLPSYLGDWWAARLTEVKEWVQTLTGTVNDAISSVNKVVNNLSTQWQLFVTSTLPSLVDISFWRSFWGGSLGSIGQWWEPQRRQLLDEVDISLEPTREEVRTHAGWLDMIKKLFTDPEEFVLELLSMIW